MRAVNAATGQVLSTGRRRTTVPQVVTFIADKVPNRIHESLRSKAPKRRSLLITAHHDEMFMTRSLSVTPKTTEQHLIVHSDKSVAYVTNNNRLCSTFCTTEANHWQTRSIARPLCDSRAALVFNLYSEDWSIIMITTASDSPENALRLRRPDQTFLKHIVFSVVVIAICGCVWLFGLIGIVAFILAMIAQFRADISLPLARKLGIASVVFSTIGIVGFIVYLILAMFYYDLSALSFSRTFAWCRQRILYHHFLFLYNCRTAAVTSTTVTDMRMSCSINRDCLIRTTTTNWLASCVLFVFHINRTVCTAYRGIEH